MASYTKTSKSNKRSDKHNPLHRTPSSLLKEGKAVKDVESFDSRRVQHSKKLRTIEYLKSCKSVASSMALVEHKESVPTFRGRDAPMSLTIPHPGFVYTDTKESIAMRDTFRSLFGDKYYKFRLSTALNMSSSGAGIVNSTISNSVLTSQADFVSLSAVFNEFFVIKFEVKWMPNSRYQYPLGGTSTLSIANLPIGKASLQHGQAAYSSMSALADNYAVGYHSTGDPFTESWINTESINSEVVPTLTAPTQAWCTVNNVANYQGTLQFLSQSAPPALPFSQVLGTFMCHWDVVFRVRA
jgi:hypothetical protein